MMKQKHAVILLTGVVAVVAAVWMVSRSGGKAPGADGAPSKTGVAGSQGKVPPTDTRQGKGAASERTTNVVDEAARLQRINEAVARGEGRIVKVKGRTYFLPHDESSKETKTLDEFLDDDKPEQALKEAMRLKNHPLPEVRSRAAFALSWLGIKGLEGLTSMLADPDPDVAEEANGYWKDMLGELESEYDKTSLLVGAAQVYGDKIPVDVLEDVVMELEMLEDVNTIAGLTEILKGLNDPEKIEIVGDAINNMADVDQPDLSKAERLRQAEQVQEEKQREALESEPTVD